MTIMTANKEYKNVDNKLNSLISTMKVVKVDDDGKLIVNRPC